MDTWTGDREEVEMKATSYNWQSFSPSLHRAEATQELAQPQTHPTTCLKALGGLFHTISDQTTQHHHHSSQNLLSPMIKDSTIHYTVTRLTAHC